MAYFAAFLHMLDIEKNKEVLPRHIQYLDELDEQGKIFARGPFLDNSGGLIVYIADSITEAYSLAEKDPHVIEGSRKLELKEWKILVKN
ncbi:YciI family protein [Bacillus sp. JJ1521]|uniref:YciI family protein n=1 Tax=Bacillus sp. JJ1521 TaxID=3122957 RepID=UPI002FFE5E66